MRSVHDSYFDFVSFLAPFIPRVAALALVSLFTLLPSLSYATTVSTYQISQRFNDNYGDTLTWQFYVSTLDNCTICTSSDLATTIAPKAYGILRYPKVTGAHGVYLTMNIYSGAFSVASFNFNGSSTSTYTLDANVNLSGQGSVEFFGGNGFLDASLNGSLDSTGKTANATLDIVDHYSGEFSDTWYFDGLSSSISTQLYSQVIVPDCSPVPLPTTSWLFGSGLLGLIGVARRKVRS